MTHSRKPEPPSGFTASPYFAGARAKRLAWLGVVALVLAALAINGRAIGFQFIASMDDDINVTLNPHMGAITLERLRWFFSDSAYVRRYIPLGWTGFSAVYGVNGLDPACYHGAALLFYLANTAAVFCIILTFLRVFAAEARSHGLPLWHVASAILCAGWWALHPLRVESTAWVSGMLYGQSMFFFLIGLLLYLRSYLRLDAGKGRTGGMTLALVCFAISLLTYPLTLGAPVMLLALDWIYAGQRRLAPDTFRRLAIEKLPFLAVSAAVMAVTFYARSSNGSGWGELPSLQHFPLASRAAQTAYVAVYYVLRPWWPFHLSPYYDTLVSFDPYSWRFAACEAALAFSALACTLSLRKRPWIFALFVAYLAMALPFSGVTEFPHYTSDRYAYFLTVMMATMMAAALSRIPGKGVRAALCAGFVLLLLFLGALSWAQVGTWRNRDTLFQHVARDLTNPGMLANLRSRQEFVDYIEGRAVPLDADIRARLATLLTVYDLKTMAAVSGAARERADVPVVAILYEHLGLAFARAGEPQEAADRLELAVRSSTGYTDAYYNLSLVLLQLGRSADALHSFFLAEACTARPLQPASRRAFLDLFAQVMEARGESGLAQAALKQAGH